MHLYCAWNQAKQNDTASRLLADFINLQSLNVQKTISKKDLPKFLTIYNEPVKCLKASTCKSYKMPDNKTNTSNIFSAMKNRMDYLSGIYYYTNLVSANNKS